MIRLLLAHPSRLVIDSLKSTLKGEAGVYVAGCATTSEELFFLLPHADLVLLGVELADKSAFQILEQLREKKANVKVLIIGINNNADTIIRYIEAGAAGYILQDESISDMVLKLKAVKQEQAIISPDIAAAMMERLVMLANLETPLAFVEKRSEQLEELSPREEEVLSLIQKSYTNREIAEALYIEYGTVKNHVHNILRKLDVSSRHEAATIYEIRMQTAVPA